MRGAARSSKSSEARGHGARARSFFRFCFVHFCGLGGGKSAAPSRAHTRERVACRCANRGGYAGAQHPMKPPHPPSLARLRPRAWLPARAAWLALACPCCGPSVPRTERARAPAALPNRRACPRAPLPRGPRARVSLGPPARGPRPLPTHLLRWHGCTPRAPARRARAVAYARRRIRAAPAPMLRRGPTSPTAGGPAVAHPNGTRPTSQRCGGACAHMRTRKRPRARARPMGNAAPPSQEGRQSAYHLMVQYHQLMVHVYHDGTIRLYVQRAAPKRT